MASAFSRIASFARRDHRYVLLGTSAIAAIGMMLSSQPRSPMSFLAHAFTVELVMYYLLVAWIVLSAVALVFKFTHWKTYAQTAPFTKPGVVRALRLGSYVIWAMVAILVVDRVVLGFASAWVAAASSTSMPKDMLVQVLYMFQQGKQTYIAGVVTTIELAVFGTVIAFSWQFCWLPSASWKSIGPITTSRASSRRSAWALLSFIPLSCAARQCSCRASLSTTWASPL